MDRTKWVVSTALILFSLASVNGQEGRLQHVRDDVRSSSSSDSKCNDSANGNDNWSDYGDFSTGYSSSQGGGDGGIAMGLVVFAPFYVPMAVLHDDYHFQLDFAPHPYANSYRGYQLLPVVYAGLYYGKDFKDVQRKEWAFRVSVENGSDFAGMNRFNGQLKLEHASRWGVVTNWNYFHEALPNGRSDETAIGDTNLTFRFAQNEVASLYAGLGFRTLTDRHQTDFGVNFAYGGDWFPVRPIVVSGSLDAGTLGSGGVILGRATIGAIFHGWEVFAGYDFLRIGDTNLQGPTAGVRLWF